MKLAYNQAGKVLGNTGNNPAVGCVIVKNNALISLAHTNFNGRPHAERIALSSKKINFKDSLLYSTLEPCSHYGKTSPCTDIIKKQNIKSVYFSKFDPDRRSFRKAKKELSKYNIKTFGNVYKSAGDNFYRDFYIKKMTNNIFIIINAHIRVAILKYLPVNCIGQFKTLSIYLSFNPWSNWTKCVPPF